ncbi:amino acid adenylation domain-containing protein [Teredinibacter sp. KSP-S5-2]|uniref:non-ribosomal peptide synthetase n=1 Tax=Teredinibacter sp. KSP-S5-2 TaxID=3034506 RepID=UPI0029351E2A|nr:amino acid adenylation domain-containing protein [Teredinibacter sp. KSP-S5-2]WNO10791.1 amino acid adenylation domain-containing protein [Teredinibacter sp. KSP-S5-2]
MSTQEKVQRKERITHPWGNAFFPDIHEAEYPSDKTIIDMFEDIVSRHLDDVAVSYLHERVTYRELNDRANQFANYLSAQYCGSTGEEIASDCLIGLFYERGLDAIIAILGVLKTGAAYLPLNPADPVNRIRYLLADTDIKVVVTENHLVRKVTPIIQEYREANNKAYPHVIPVNPENYADESTRWYSQLQSAGDLAYVIYTSGTTGKPKGVMIEHQGVINLAHSRKTDFLINNKSVVLQFSPITFDASVCEIFSALLNGATLAIIDDESKIDGDKIIEFIDREKVSVATIVPSLLAQMTYSDAPLLPSLKTLVVAGEACTQSVVSKWRPGRRMINAYGPTETTVCATVNHFQDDDVPTNIGLAIQNMYVYLLDESLNLVGLGEVGELYIGGVGLARGYLNKPELTAERFIDDPFSTPLKYSDKPSKLYKTGDLGRYLPNGKIEYIGRNDHQVKIRGHRIELGEIESVLLKYPGVSNVCVLAKSRKSANQTDNRSNYLAVFYTAEQKIETGLMVAHMSNYLPGYMVPSVFHWLEAFPTTTNGKVDRNQLEQIELHSESGEQVAPRTDIEQELYDIWLSVLGVESLSIHDDFFELGGDSLLAIRLTLLINTKFDKKISTAQLLEAGTIAKMADLLLIEDVPSEGFEPILRIRHNEQRPGLFFVHPSMSGSELYMKMVNWLDADQPFYGVESYNFNHLDSPETDLISLAQRYIRYIKSIQASGPYFLGGYSLGGNIAYEVAHQLIGMGENVDGLYLIDSVLPSPTAKKQGISDREAKQFLEYFGFEGGKNQRLLDLVKTEMSLLFSYIPDKKLPIKISLVKAKNLLSPLTGLPSDHIAHHLFQLDRPYNGWDQYAKEVNQYELDANHETIVQPDNLQKIASLVQKDINSPEIYEMFAFWS